MKAAFDLTALVRPEVRSRRAYHLDLAPCRFKLDQNEVPWDLPRAVKEKIAARLVARDFARYPDFHSAELCAALGRHHGHPAEGVLVGNGSNELLRVALDSFVAPGTEVLGLAPCFALYAAMVEAPGGRFVALPPGPGLALAKGELVAEVERDPHRPVLLTSPNNPTGEAFTVSEVAALLERLEAPLLLDNAYGEFCRFDYRPLLARYPHLLLFRTFSKAWSLAGIRLGYLLAAPELVCELIKVKLPYNVGHAGQVAGVECLAAGPLVARRVAWLNALRPRYAACLAAHGFEVLPSEANFLLVRCPGGEARRVAAALCQRGILVRDVSGTPELAGFLRVSIGRARALRALDAALDEIAKESP